MHAKWAGLDGWSYLCRQKIMLHEDVDWRELVWFVGVTVGVHAGVVSLLSSALMVVERYKLFPEAKIQTKVHTH